MSETRAWIGVISKRHVLLGVAGGFTQVCHGKRAPLSRMAPGDVFIAYSPKTDMHDGEPLRAFTAVGRVGAGPVVRFDMGNGFVPFRRPILWDREAREVPLDALRGSLAFVRDPSWGRMARRGHFPISPEDGACIVSAMGAAGVGAHPCASEPRVPRQGRLAL